MSHVLDDLVDLLSLEAIEENLFRGRSQDLGFRQLYGGQVLGQSLSAASQTVEDARHVHSLPAPGRCQPAGGVLGGPRA